MPTRFLAAAALLVALQGAAAELPLGVAETPDGTSVRVWAPNARSVDIVGDFNGWKATSSEHLQREGDNGIWSTLLKRSLPNGAYRFLINGDLARRDPYGRAVAGDSKSSLFYSSGGFRWEGDQQVNIPIEDLVIYEMHVGTFNDPKPQDGRPGTFYDAITRLDKLVDLGVNCVELLPVHEFPGSQSWGYNPSDPFAVEQAYGGPDGLKTFVRECHKRGLAVHLDIVHNHYGPGNLDLLRFDGTGNPNDGGIYFYDGPGINMTPWGPRVRFDAPQVRRFVKDNAFMWLDEYHVDGFRWDSTTNIRAYNNGQSAIPAGQQMLNEINAAIHQQDPGRISIAEDSLGIGNFDASWDYDFHHAVMPELQAREDRERRVRAIAGALSPNPTMWRVVYVDNHDEAGKINGQQRIASDIDPSKPESDYARRLCGIGALLTFTAPGTPLLFFGNEMQESGSFHDDRPLDWGKWTRNAGTVALHRDLIRLRRNLDVAGIALKGTGLDVPVMDDSQKLLVYWRWHDREPDRQMVIAVNLSGQPMRGATVPFPSKGPWMTRLYTDWKKYGGESKEETLPFQFKSAPYRGSAALAPYSAKIFALAPGAAAQGAVAVQASVPAPPPAAEPAGFSMYASLNLVGDFNGWNLTAWPMKRTKGLLWERRVTFTNQPPGAFKISANDSGVIFWGGEWNPVDSFPYRATLKRLGPNVKITATLDGDYLVRFNEDTLELSIEQLASAPRAAALPLPAYRTWTDLQGKQIEARLAGMDGAVVALERRDGKRLRVPIEHLSPADRDYIRTASH